MRARTWLGTLILGFTIASAAGCADPPPQPHRNPSKPIATARVTSSALTKKITGAKAWRIYEGKTQVVVMGFDAKGAPVDGIRVRYASKRSDRRWAVSFESLRNGGVLQIGRDGAPVKKTMSEEGLRTLVGASRVLDAWTRKRAGTTLAPKALYSAASTVGECGVAATGAVRDCAPLVRTCARWGYIGARRGRHYGAIGATLACLAWNWRRTAQCAGSAIDAGKTCYEASQSSASEEQRNGEPSGESGDGPPKDDEQAGTTGEGEGSDDYGTPPSVDDPAGDDASAEWNDDLENPESSGDASWDAEQSQEEAEAAAEDPEAPLDEQVEEGDGYADESSSGDEYDANPSDPEEDAISDESSEDYAEESAHEDSSEEYASEDEGTDDSSSEESSDDVETESFRPILLAKNAKNAKTATRSRGGACGASRVLQCGARATTAFCRCVR
jgi:hypothetical protein